RSAHPAGPRHADVFTEGHYSAPPADLNVLDPTLARQASDAGSAALVSSGASCILRSPHEWSGS
ncbi:diaminopimelate decarboxylase, partial [Streptomyces sp. NPDC005534]